MHAPRLEHTRHTHLLEPDHQTAVLIVVISLLLSIIYTTWLRSLVPYIRGINFVNILVPGLIPEVCVHVCRAHRTRDTARGTTTTVRLMTDGATNVCSALLCGTRYQVHGMYVRRFVVSWILDLGYGSWIPARLLAHRYYCILDLVSWILDPGDILHGCTVRRTNGLRQEHQSRTGT